MEGLFPIIVPQHAGESTKMGEMKSVYGSVKFLGKLDRCHIVTSLGQILNILSTLSQETQG